MFIFERQRERERTQAGEGAERKREEQRIRSRLCADRREPNLELELTNREIMT